MHWIVFLVEYFILFIDKWLKFISPGIGIKALLLMMERPQKDALWLIRIFLADISFGSKDVTGFKVIFVFPTLVELLNTFLHFVECIEN